MFKRLMALLAVTALAAGCLTPKTSRKIDDLVPKLRAPEPVAHYARNVVWASPGGVASAVDVSWPQGAGPFPVLVWFHGGSWNLFSKEANEGLARYITNRGYTVINVDYRMRPEVTMKTIIEDAMGAVIWAKDHAAEYNGDPSRLAVAGHSAGAHLAAMVAEAGGDPYFTPTYQSQKGNDCKVRAAIPVSGVYDLVLEYNNIQKGQMSKKDWTELMGATLEEDPELYKKCSPLSYLRKDQPPELVRWGEKDFLRPFNEDWVKKLQEIGAPVEEYMQPGVDHLWPTWHWTKSAIQTYDRMIKFLDEQLKGN